MREIINYQLAEKCLTEPSSLMVFKSTLLIVSVLVMAENELKKEDN
jgi:hypothetical protein